MRIIYTPMKLRKTKNKILWLSRQSDDKSIDMIMLERELKKRIPETEHVFRLRKMKAEAPISLSYIFHLLRDMWELASAKVVIVDTYSVSLSCLKHKKNLKAIQMWHAIGAVKKFGYQSLGKAFGRNAKVARAMCMHKNYDYVFAPSEATATFYCEAFGCSEDNIRVLSLPRVDAIINSKSRYEEFIELNPDYKDRKIVAYIPTFRDGDEKYTNDICSAFDKNAEFKLVVSAHPLSKFTERSMYKFNGDFTSTEIMMFSDVVITDYSACAFEAAIIGKPLYFYVPDYDSYKQSRGLNIEIESEMPDISFRSAASLVSALSDFEYDFGVLSRFGDKYIENKYPNNTERMAEFVCSLI